MKITIERAEALKALLLVQSVSAKKSTVQIMSNIMLQVGDHGVFMTAAGSDMEAKTFAKCAVFGGGKTTVPGQQFLDMLKSLPEGADLEMSDEDSDSMQPPVKIKAGRAKFTLPTLDADLFPVLQDPVITSTFEMSGKVLAALIDDTAFSADGDSSRPFHKVLHFHLKGDNLRCVAMKHAGLAYRDEEAPDSAIGFEPVSISVNHAAEMKRLVDQAGDDPVKIERSANRVIVTVGPTVLRMTVDALEYIDYEAILGRVRVTHTIHVDVDLITGAMRRALVSVTEKVRALRWSSEGGSLKFVGRNMQLGDSADEIDADIEGEDFSVSILGPALLDCLGRIRTEAAVIKITDMQGQGDSRAPGPFLICETGEPKALFVTTPLGA